MNTFLTSPISSRAYYFFSFLISIVYLAWVFPLDYFTGSNPFWFDIRTDPTQHVTGLWAFLADDWHFPLLYTTYLNYPEGVSTAYTDIIPIAALLFKPIASLFPQHTHYFGFWVGLSFILQGLAGAYFLANATRKNYMTLVAGTLFALMAPSLMIRLPHTALLSQALLIFALALYYLSVHEKLPAKQATKLQWTTLMLATLIHPYFVAMLFPLYAATHITLMMKKRVNFTYSALEISLSLFSIIFLMWIVGYIIPSTGVFRPAPGFDINSMNLLSPFLGTHLAGSLFLPSEAFKLDATGLQIDGHNYLGISVLLLLLWALLFQTKELIQGIKYHAPMSIVLLLMTLYALSNTIYMADTKILSYTLPEFLNSLTGTFRSSGRFFWPVGYFLLFIPLILLIKKTKEKYLPLVLFSLIILQVIDMAPHRAYVYESAHREPYYKVDQLQWHHLLASSQNVYLFPSYKCGADYIDPLMMQYFATYSKKPYNTGFVARATGSCELKNIPLSQAKQNNDLFVFSKEKFPLSKVKEVMGKNTSQWCRKHTIGTVCKIGSDKATWSEYGEDFSIITP